MPTRIGIAYNIQHKIIFKFNFMIKFVASVILVSITISIPASAYPERYLTNPEIKTLWQQITKMNSDKVGSGYIRDRLSSAQSLKIALSKQKHPTKKSAFEVEPGKVLNGNELRRLVRLHTQADGNRLRQAKIKNEIVNQYIAAGIDLNPTKKYAARLQIKTDWVDLVTIDAIMRVNQDNQLHK